MKVALEIFGAVLMSVCFFMAGYIYRQAEEKTEQPATVALNPSGISTETPTPDVSILYGMCQDPVTGDASLLWNGRCIGYDELETEWKRHNH